MTASPARVSASSSSASTGSNAQDGSTTNHKGPAADLPKPKVALRNRRKPSKVNAHMNDFNQNSNLSEIRVERSASGEVVRVDVGGGGISNFKEKPSDRPPLQPLENHLQTTIPACDDVAMLHLGETVVDQLQPTTAQHESTPPTCGPATSTCTTVHTKQKSSLNP